MRSYFPFTNYDFYAYLTSGGLLLAIVDFALNNAQFLSKGDWTVVQITIAVASAYVLGHLIAMLAQGLLETFVLSKVIAKPIILQLGFKEANWFEKLIGFLVGRNYTPFPKSTRNKILAEAASQLGKSVEEITDAEEVFLLGFKNSFRNEKSRERIDDFRNQYGFCRNIAFVGLAATVLLSWQAWSECRLEQSWFALIAFLLFLGMFVRFVKFLASFQAEVMRSVQ